MAGKISSFEVLRVWQNKSIGINCYRFLFAPLLFNIKNFDGFNKKSLNGPITPHNSILTYDIHEVNSPKP